MPVTPKSGHRHSKPFGGKPYGILKSYKSHVLKTKAEETQRSHLEQFKMPTLIHVGNLRPHITEQHIKEYFSSCGIMVGTQIALAQGSQPNVHKPATGYDQNHAFPDLRSATVKFSDTQGVQKALELHGTFLMGCHITVSLSALDLPEMQNFIRQRLDKIAGISPAKARGRKLRLEPTLVVTPENFKGKGRAGN